jgi:glucose/arabinose dehydrogenase
MRATTPALTAAAAVTALVLMVAGAAGRGTPPIGDGTGGVALETVGEFSSPVNVAFAPGEPNAYVVEQRGTVQVIPNGGAPQTFLNIDELTEESGERGLLGLAFHPDYQSNGLVYAYYNDEDNGDVVVSEFEASDPLDADESSRRQVIRIRHRFASNHNGGQLLFGPDGYLYLAPGDGGSAGDPRENAQNKRSLLGKLLRIDPLASGDRPYTTPETNPLKHRTGRDEILARGLRNPFRFSFDGTRILIGDVGQDRFEEVDYEAPKTLRNANFGWDRWEGFRRYDDGDTASTPKRKRHDKPIHAYGHGTDGFSCAITGGVVVRDENLESLYGRYLYADFCAGELRSLVPKLGGAEAVRKLGVELNGATSFVADPATQEVYATSLDGPIVRLVPAP